MSNRGIGTGWNALFIQRAKNDLHVVLQRSHGSDNARAALAGVVQRGQKAVALIGRDRDQETAAGLGIDEYLFVSPRQGRVKTGCVSNEFPVGGVDAGAHPSFVHVQGL